MAIKRRNAQIGVIAAALLLAACLSVLFVQGSASASSSPQHATPAYDLSK